MSDSVTEMRRWQDWTDPDFFMPGRQQERRLIPLFFRQILPKQMQKTRLTLSGWILIVVAMGIGSAAYNTASNILFMTLSLVLSSLILSGILSLINFRKLNWTLRSPGHLQVGEVGLAEVELANRKRLFPSMNLAFRVATSEQERFSRLYLNHAISARERTSLSWSFVPKRRGIFYVHLHGVESKFPFGFLLKGIGTTTSQRLLVWPARTDYLFKPSSSGHRRRSGASRNRAGAGSDLLNIRRYERGDPPRLIHWKATARMNQLMTRQLAQEGDSGFHVEVDASSSDWSQENLETLCSAACALAEDLFHEGRLETVSVGNEEPLSVRGLREVHEFFDQLALLEAGSKLGEAAQKPRPFRRNDVITFQPLGEGGVSIQVNGEEAGQA